MEWLHDVISFPFTAVHWVVSNLLDFLLGWIW